MNSQKGTEKEICDNTNQLKYLKFELINDKHVVTLIDLEGYEIIKGYGNTINSEINDLHSCLI